MKIVTRLVFATAFAAGLAGFAGAKENYRETAAKADTKDAFAQLSGSIREEMAPDGRYEYVKPDEKAKVEAALDRMAKMFDATPTVAAMTQDQKIALFNEQEKVNSILTLRDRDRVICRKEAPIGSHIPVTSCHTYGQEVEAREGSKKQMDEWGRGQCRGKCGGS